MRWKTVALAGALGPTAIGCGIAQNTTRTVVNEICVGKTQHCVHRDLKKEASTVWKEVRCQYPRRAFTAEFHDGFVDGYVDYLDRGGNASMPAVTPAKYTRHKKYFTENGQCLAKDYFLGFKYGQEIAIATGKRQFLTVPVLLPDRPPEPPRFTIEPRDDAATLPPPMPLPTPPPGITPTPPPAPTPVPAPPVRTDALPAPSPPLPTIPEAPRSAQPPVTPAPVPVPVAVPQLPVPLPKLPAPPAEVPELPEYIPTPPITDELPVVPPYTGELPVVPPSHPEATGK